MIKRINNIKNYYPYFIIFIIFHLIYFKLNIESNTKLKTLISFYSSLSIFMSIYSLNMQINQTKLNRISSDVVYINNIFSNIDNDIYNFFSKNDKMYYYYYELYNGNSNENEENSNEENSNEGNSNEENSNYKEENNNYKEENNNYKEEDRNINLEKFISFKILFNFETLINYIDALRNVNSITTELDIAEEKLKKILNIFLKSKIFIEYWKEYSKTLAMDWTKDYFDLYFEYY